MHLFQNEPASLEYPQRRTAQVSNRNGVQLPTHAPTPKEIPKRSRLGHAKRIRDPKNIGVYEQKPKFSGEREVMVLKREFIQLRNEFLEHNKLNSPPLNIIQTRQRNNIGLFLAFLTKAKRTLEGCGVGPLVLQSQATFTSSSTSLNSLSPVINSAFSRYASAAAKQSA